MSAPPAPDTSAMVDSMLDATLGVFTRTVTEGWPYIAPFLTLRVGLEFWFWWLSWRAAKREPKQLALF